VKKKSQRKTKLKKKEIELIDKKEIELITMKEIEHSEKNQTPVKENEIKSTDNKNDKSEKQLDTITPDLSTTKINLNEDDAFSTSEKYDKSEEIERKRKVPQINIIQEDEVKIINEDEVKVVKEGEVKNEKSSENKKNQSPPHLEILLLLPQQFQIKPPKNLQRNHHLHQKKRMIQASTFQKSEKLEEEQSDYIFQSCKSNTLDTIDSKILISIYYVKKYYVKY